MGKSSKQLIKKYCRRNKINISIANSFTIIKIKNTYNRLQRIYKQNWQRSINCWIENELKSYHWLLIAYSVIKDKLICDYDEQQWCIFKQIYYCKQKNNLNYQAIKLINKNYHNKNNCNKKLWQKQQDQLLIDIFKNQNLNNKWSLIARKLFNVSRKKYFRSAKQCRQRWLNHLDPNKIKGKWTNQQDQIIIEYILKDGKKWSEISRKLGNHRTQHMVKNRVKSILIKEKKHCQKKNIQNQKILLQTFLKNELNIQEQKQQQQQYEQQEQYEQEQQEQNKIHSQENIENILVGQAPLPKDLLQQLQLTAKLSNNSNNKNNNNNNSNNNNNNNSSSELQQIFTPFYVNFQSMTPNYISTSPSIPFFMGNSSFSLYDNNCGQQFLRNQKNDHQ